MGKTATPRPFLLAALAAILSIPAVQAEGFTFRSEDNEFTGRFGGQLLQNGRFFADSNPRNDTFSFKKARLEASGTAYKAFDYKVQGDFSGSSAVLDDGWFSWRLPGDSHALRFGQFKVPFSQAELTSYAWQDFPEKPVVVRLAPSRDQGIGFSGRCWDDRISWEGGVFNGTGANTADTNDHKEYAGRILVRPLADAGPEALAALRLGLAATTGLETAAAADITSPASGTTILDFDPATSRTKAENRFGYELAWFHGPASVTGEFVRDSFTVERTYTTGGITIHRDAATIDAWHLGGTWLLTGEEKKLDKAVRVAEPVTRGGWGAWEVAFRIAHWNPSQNLFANQPTDSYASKGTSAEKMFEYAAGINFYPVDHVRFSVAWIRNDFDTPIDIGEQDMLGDENVIVTRAQIDF